MAKLSVLQGKQMKQMAELKIADVRKLMVKVNKEVAGPLLHGAILDNFLAGGRPTFRPNSKITMWFKRHKGSAGVGKPLVDTGEMFQKAVLDPVIKADEAGVTLAVRHATQRLRASMPLLHAGGTVNMVRTPRMRRFFWAMSFKARDAGDLEFSDIFRRAALSRKNLIIKIPPRPWTKLLPNQERDIKRAAQEAYIAAINNYAQTGRLTLPSTPKKI
jgi:phage gpG-like protein